MTAKLVLCAALAGCAATDYVTEHGSVYECQGPDDVLELCTELDQEQLEHVTGWQCWPTTRLWPRLTGCLYSCEPHRGCNATAGCFCPEGA